MIHYDLRCASGHAFDGWFASSSAFEAQSARGILECPVCGTSAVERALMTPAVPKKRARPTAAADAARPEPKAEPDAKPEPTADKAPVALTDERSIQLRAAAEAFRKAITENGVDVGRAFPQEARKIHYGESDSRSIYGQADADEVSSLLDEGIEVLPLPGSMDRRN